MSSTHHRSGVWVQKNKNHKTGPHRSKGELRTDKKGRVDTGIGFKKGKPHTLNKNERRNQHNQKRALRLFATLQEKQKFESVPLDVLLISLSDQVSVENFISLLRTQEEAEDVEMDGERSTVMRFPRWKISLNFQKADTTDLWNTLDLAKVSDLVVFLYDPFEEMSQDAEDLLSSLLAQGLPALIHCLYIEVEKDQNVQLFLKEKSEVKKQLQKKIKKWFPEPQIDFVSGESDIPTLLFRLSTVRPDTTEYREMRPYIVSSDVTFTPNADRGDVGSLKVTGIVKGGMLDVNGFVHIIGHGDYLLSELQVIPRKTKKSTKAAGGSDLEMGTVVKVDPSKQPSTEEDEDMESEAMSTSEVDTSSVFHKKKIMKSVPKGTSKYQAAWIVDEDAHEKELGEGEDLEEDADDVKTSGRSRRTLRNMKRLMLLTIHRCMTTPRNTEEEEAAFAKRKEKEETDDRLFPDEVDTPVDQPARVRFFKYRGMDDFRSASWEADENLPKDYSKICQFSNMKLSKKAALDVADKTVVPSFNAVSVVLRNVPKAVTASKMPLILYGLLPHEHQMTVVNLAIKRVTSFTETVRQNEELIFQVGFRRFKAKALLSELSAGKLHKCLRFMPAEGHFAVSLYAPIIFPPAPVLMYKETSPGSLVLIGTGTVLSLDPSRVVLKRTVLSGHPYKINVRSAVIRFMFFNTEDVNWFRKIRLSTKHGRIGEIKEPLGTHGHMKCRFDGQLQSSDTVLMKLYKRVYPKWTYMPLCSAVEI
ncbi:Pre-rRNA-processing protein TSR1-like protein [Hypsibius exemplaris]|uniref:Pre-rRNA-processing protein TSR1 homolog n=1 Tax=Hypsibius exemplaris TaxID=2072580 RepID=A0A1W0WY43_HYPEX|nr:Pre-rRNA-processing protein TSR1-like protein [Hypsibius exemplaris]